jgi:hypothetical protein
VSSDDSNLAVAFYRLYRYWAEQGLEYREDICSIRPWIHESLSPKLEVSTTALVEFGAPIRSTNGKRCLEGGLYDSLRTG